MASIINSISFKNFFNYYDDYEKNKYDLDKGVNIIVADNGAGKSKFFNAFLWLFKGVILDSDDKVEKSIKDVFVKIISDKAKNETSIHDNVTCGIRVEYSYGSLWKYEITKSFIATRIGEEITSPESWQFFENETEVNKTELVLIKYKPVYDEDEKRKIIDKLIMPKFRRYSFLQGEEVDNIIDFTKKSSIEDAVRNLTDIQKYERLFEVTEYIRNRAEKDLQSQNKASSEQNERLSIATFEKEKTQLQLGHELELLKQYEDNYEKAEQEKINLDKTYANAEKRKEIDDKLKIANKKVREANDEYMEFLDRINNRFFDGNFAWISMGFENIMPSYKDLNESFTQKRYKKKALIEVKENPNNFFHCLPVDSPDLVSLQNMIDNEHCYVCNREAKEGTSEYNYLLELRDRPKEKSKEKPFVKNDLKDFFDSLQINAQPFYNKIESVKDSVTQTRKKEEELKSKLNKLKENVKSLKDERKNVLVSGDDSENNAINIIQSYQQAIRQMENARTKIDDNFKPKIKKLRADIRSLGNEISSLSMSQDIPKGFVDNYDIAKDISHATEKAKERVYQNMIDLLEKHANKHFQNLISRSEVSGGILKFEKSPSGAIAFNYVDNNNHIVAGNSEGFQRMKKFSVVMAIISANKSEYNYPLLADAPISAFGSAFTEGFFEATGNVFPQSIILVKELYDVNTEDNLNSLGRRLLKDNNVKTMYVNHVTPGAEQIDRVTTKTKIK